jgi:RNA polymerase sigma-70 factor (sigma-E family)
MGGSVKPSDEQAYREYVVARIDALRRTAYLLCHDWHLADDLVSITLDKLYWRWRLAWQSSNPEAYVRAMLVNAWIDERRRPWRRETPTEQLPDRSDAAWPIRDGAGDELGVLGLLRALPPRRRAVLVLRFYCDLSIVETAAILDLPIGTVKTHTTRGLEALRAAITNETGVRP